MKVSNTLSGQKEEFSPHGNEVKMYVCGVTPYADSHIGHAMSYIIFDVIRRYLRFRGYRVKYVQNITDIDDKIIDRANRLGIPPRELAEKYTNSYFDDMDALNIELADIYPRATEEIPKIIEVIQGLIDKEHAYPAQGSVYFRVRSVADYGKLAHRSLESMIAGARIEAAEEKEYPMDFVLWKASKPDEPAWESPWGPGRPGWHIECSAMSLKYLGETIDIHGGGYDLVFPHHENEIAQSESFTGKKPFVKYWLHNGLLQFGEDKMSKSLGNLITIKEARDRYSIDAIRIFVLGSHYRSPLTYSEEALEAAEKGADRLRQAAHGQSKGEKTDRRATPDIYRQRFIEAMDDDFNTAQALAVLFDLARDINRADEAGFDATGAREKLKELGGIIGLTLKIPEELSFEERLYNKSISLEQHSVQHFEETLNQIRADLPQLDNSEAVRNRLFNNLRNQLVHGTYSSLDDVEKSTQRYLNELTSLRNRLTHSQDFREIQDSLRALSNSAAINTGTYSTFRDQLREAKQWQLADEIRDELAKLGIAIEDTPGGTVWKYRRQPGNSP